MADNTHFSSDKFIEYALERGFGDVHFKIDAKTQLVAIIAIHNTTLGPALGGCRYAHYPNFTTGWHDALRLARSMSYKAALAGLSHGGGKSVLIRPPYMQDRTAYFHSFGEFINSLNGRYITAVDVGTTTFDMDIIGAKSPYVSCLTEHGEPSPYTALGVRYGIEAAVQFKLKKSSLQGVHVALQGLGKVGLYLAKDLHQLGARLSISDINTDVIERFVKEYGATAVPVDQIHKIPCDVFAPCALGAILNEHTIAQIQAPIVAGSANNQLEHSIDGVRLHEKGILYAPDYVVNSGGLIHASTSYYHLPSNQIESKLAHIPEILSKIFERSMRENKPTSVIADIMAEEKLNI